MQSNPTPRYFIQRAWIYSREMFPILMYLPYVVALYACMNFIVQKLSGDELVVDQSFYVGLISAFFMMLLMRTFDDLKDFDLDKELFPHRATARKAVLRSDIVAISLVSFLIVLNVNIFFGQLTLPLYAIMISYCLLTFKWFFAEQFHRNHIFITMMDHQPIPYVINFFLIHTALASGPQYESFSSVHLFLWLIVSMPVTAWEVSRKIRSADKETTYETFSMVLGVRTATAIPLLFFLATCFMSIYIGYLLDFSLLFHLFVGVLMAIIVWIYGRFLMYPLDKYNILTKASLLITTALFVNLFVHTALSFLN